MKPFRDMFRSVRSHLGVAVLAGLCTWASHAFVVRTIDNRPHISTMYFNTYLGLEPFSNDPWEVSDFEATEERLKADPNLARFCAGLRREIAPILTSLDQRDWKTSVWTIGVAGPARGRPFLTRQADFKMYIESEARATQNFDHQIMMCGADGTKPERPLGFVLNGISYYAAIWGFFALALRAYPKNHVGSNRVIKPTSFDSQFHAT